MGRVGNALIVLGLLALSWGVLWQFGVAPGSRTALPQPLALERAGPSVREVAVAPPVAAPRPTVAAAPTIPALPTVAAPPVTLKPADPTPAPTPVAVPTAAPITLISADVADRAQASIGYAVRLAIPTIKLDTPVKQGGVVQDAHGDPVWETLPFVAVHYGELTARIGARGNAVIAGHVVTLSEGNVFRLLYKVNLDDQVEVWDDRDRQHDFRVVAVKLVPPSDTSVMAPTADETLTLITCGGTFDPAKREFSDRLIVTAKPL
jgi:LPXTG-site transpeptidase (sortase) family protein